MKNKHINISIPISINMCVKIDKETLICVYTWIILHACVSYPSSLMNLKVIVFFFP